MNNDSRQTRSLVFLLQDKRMMLVNSIDELPQD